MSLDHSMKQSTGIRTYCARSPPTTMILNKRLRSSRLEVIWFRCPPERNFARWKYEVVVGEMGTVAPTLQPPAYVEWFISTRALLKRISSDCRIYTPEKTNKFSNVHVSMYITCYFMQILSLRRKMRRSKNQEFQILGLVSSSHKDVSMYVKASIGDENFCPLYILVSSLDAYFRIFFIFFHRIWVYMQEWFWHTYHNLCPRNIWRIGWLHVRTDEHSLHQHWRRWKRQRFWNNAQSEVYDGFVTSLAQCWIAAQITPWALGVPCTGA